MNSIPSKERVEEELTYVAVEVGEDVGEDEVVSYLVPLLAADASSSSSSSLSQTPPLSDDDDVVGRNIEDEEVEAVEDADRAADVVAARGSGERSAARATDEDTLEGSRESTAHTSRLTNEEEGSADDEGVEANWSGDVQGTTDADNGGGGGDGEGPEGNRDEEVNAPASDEDEKAEDVDDDDRHHHYHPTRGVEAGSTNYANAFPHSRVKEILKYEGSSSIVSRDAAAAACEAVALLMRDLVAMAAAETTRKNRKTISYDDVARVAQLLDRFSFLADVVPPAPPASSAASTFSPGKSIVVGSHLPSSFSADGGGGASRKKVTNAASRSKSVQGQRGRPHGASPAAASGAEKSAAARSKTTHARVMLSAKPQGVHPQPGGMRQSTLRF